MLGVKNISNLQTQHLIRDRVLITKRYQNKVIVNNASLNDYSSSDYLALSWHSSIKKAYQDAGEQYGFGALASPVISGYYKIHQALEEKISEILGQRRTILFNSGFAANHAMMSAALDKHDVVLADKLSHISLLQGIQLSGATRIRFPHNHLARFKDLVEKHQPTAIATESVFSMDGDIAPIREISQVTQKYQTRLMIDHAHGFGWCDHVVKSKGDLVSLSMSKACASMGGAITGTQEDIEQVLQFAKSYQYSTGLSPVVAAGILATLEVIDNESWRTHQLLENIMMFNQLAREKNIMLVSDDLTPIRSIIVGDNQKVLLLQEKLMQKGFFVAAIRTPSVPKNTARLRITLNACHEHKVTEQLLDVISEQ